MTSSSRDRISVDLHGLGTALADRAKGRGVNVSSVVRDAVARFLEFSPSRVVSATPMEPATAGVLRRVSIRLTREAAARLDGGARAAGLSRSSFVTGLVEEVPMLKVGGRRDHLDALISSSSELSTLSRNVRHLANLLRESEFSAAQEYRGMLDLLVADIGRHLELAGQVIRDMTPARRARSVRANRLGQRDEEIR
jgi:hypothetical protein